MNNNKKLIIFVIGFIVLLAGASVLYNMLSEGTASNQLAGLVPEETRTGETVSSEYAEQAADSETTQNGQEDAEEQNTAAQEAGAETENSSEETDMEQYAAPDFLVYDADGNEARLSDYIGKPIVLNFWASWCGPCKSEMPEFNDKFLEVGDKVQFLMVNMTTSSRETFDNAKGYVEGEGFAFPVLYDLDSEAATVYGVYSLPTTYFVSAEGYLIAQATGAINAELLQQGIDMILSK